MDLIFQYGLQGVIAYGIVGLINLALYRKGIIFIAEYKLALLIFIAFLVGFVPADLGNMLLDKIKIAVEVGFGISALNTVANKIGNN